ncbi:MAG: excisionase [Oceanospirillaceae bacterium]|nr:excisionase [Oceanospirillaceae bacterium]
MNLVTIKKFSELSGYSEEAVRQKIKKGVWRLRDHVIKAPDGRILIKLDKVEEWALIGN